MASKNNIVSTILFVIYSVLFVIFAITIFFGGQKIGGAIYFIFFAITVAFAFLDRKYHSNFVDLYRYSTYLSDLFNILAVSSIVYYRVQMGYMIAVLSLLLVCLLIDLFAKNRPEKRRRESILVSIFNCVLMFTIFPYFFLADPGSALAIVAVIVAVAVMILKLLLALIPYKSFKASEQEQKSNIKIEEVEFGNTSDHDVE